MVQFHHAKLEQHTEQDTFFTYQKRRLLAAGIASNNLLLFRYTVQDDGSITVHVMVRRGNTTSIAGQVVVDNLRGNCRFHTHNKYCNSNISVANLHTSEIGNIQRIVTYQRVGVIADVTRDLQNLYLLISLY